MGPQQVEVDPDAAFCGSGSDFLKTFTRIWVHSDLKPVPFFQFGSGSLSKSWKSAILAESRSESCFSLRCGSGSGFSFLMRIRILLPKMMRVPQQRMNAIWMNEWMNAGACGWWLTSCRVSAASWSSGKAPGTRRTGPRRERWIRSLFKQGKNRAKIKKSFKKSDLTLYKAACNVHEAEKQTKNSVYNRF